MKSLILAFLICLPFYSLFAQKTEKVFYNSSLDAWGLLGSTETLLIPDDSVYLLYRISYGKLSGGSIDTLCFKDGVYEGEKWRITFNKKRMVLNHLGEFSWSKKLRFKEFERCDSFINRRQNYFYARLLYYELKETTQKLLKEPNEQWSNRPRHNSEIVPQKDSETHLRIYGEQCHKEFKLVADSIHKENIALLMKLAKKERE
ncbi:hypothetical protein ACD591_05300 [Rufibacter glacialis]|uniref:Uncharacterized protein n=1 Tax=Rufibacter glacialis TaxID=1259555 RepID=A0A5M8QKE7_9BACT|nr:hypothetical protein [Rufibacter glacialis]KAA6434762.1 hypothetical protein FOE74_11355 [Rufibacter glacialis]